MPRAHSQFRPAEAGLAATDAGDDWTFQLRGLDRAPEAVARHSRQGDKGRAGIDELAAAKGAPPGLGAAPTTTNSPSTIAFVFNQSREAPLF